MAVRLHTAEGQIKKYRTSCTGCCCGGCGFLVARTIAKPAGVSLLKPHHGREEGTAFFKELLEMVWLG